MEKEFIFKELSDDEKKVLLSAYGYCVNDEGDIVDVVANQKVYSKNTRKPLNLKNVALLSGSLIVTDSDPLTISRYLRENVENGSG